MLDHRNDYSLVALGGHCCWLIVTLALVGGHVDDDEPVQ